MIGYSKWLSCPLAGVAMATLAAAPAFAGDSSLPGIVHVSALSERVIVTKPVAPAREDHAAPLSRQSSVPVLRSFNPSQAVSMLDVAVIRGTGVRLSLAGAPGSAQIECVFPLIAALPLSFELPFSHALPFAVEHAEAAHVPGLLAMGGAGDSVVK